MAVFSGDSDSVRSVLSWFQSVLPIWDFVFEFVKFLFKFDSGIKKFYLAFGFCVFLIELKIAVLLVFLVVWIIVGVWGAPEDSYSFFCVGEVEVEAWCG